MLVIFIQKHYKSHVWIIPLQYNCWNWKLEKTWEIMTVSYIIIITECQKFYFEIIIIFEVHGHKFATLVHYINSVITNWGRSCSLRCFTSNCFPAENIMLSILDDRNTKSVLVIWLRSIFELSNISAVVCSNKSTFTTFSRLKEHIHVTSYN